MNDGITLAEELRIQAEQCRDCKLCVRECRFLQEHGSPKEIAMGFDRNDPDGLSMAYDCSLCGLCGAVCPAGIWPDRMFLDMRREAVRQEVADLGRYRTVLGYEKRGNSWMFRLYCLPDNCTTVLFPGCTFTGTRPDTLRQLFGALKRRAPNLGLVLDCCAKPSHDLGREESFQRIFPVMRDYLVAKGVTTVLTVCPSCHRIFSTYGAPLRAQSVYEVLAEEAGGQSLSGCHRAVLHDPCVMRGESRTQESVRRLVAAQGVAIVEMKHHAVLTFCCGEGGSVAAVRPDLAHAWRDRRQEEAEGEAIITYCAGCVNFLGRERSHHVLDLHFDPQGTMAGTRKIARAPWTYLNRLLIKRSFKKLFGGAACSQKPSI